MSSQRTQADVQVELPFHLANLAGTGRVLTLPVTRPVTIRSLLETLEQRYPMLRGTIRDHGTLARRPFLRFFCCEQDLSHLAPDTPLPEAACEGKEPFIILGSISGG